MKKYKTISINPELHTEIKVASAQLNRDMGAVVEKVLRDWLKNKDREAPNGSQPKQTGE